MLPVEPLTIAKRIGQCHRSIAGAHVDQDVIGHAESDSSLRLEHHELVLHTETNNTGEASIRSEAS